MLKIVIVTYQEVDETDTQAWNPENGSPAEITQAQLEDEEIQPEELIQAAYEQSEPFDCPHFYVTEVMNIDIERRKILDLEDLRK